MNFDQIASELIRAIRGDMSQASLNRRLGTRGNQVGRWETSERRISWRDFVRICDICGVELAQAIRSMRPEGGELNDSTQIAKRVIGAAALTDVARRTGISRFTLMRWTKGEGCPTLADMLNLIHHCQFTLFELLRNLVNVDDLPSIRDAYQERQARKQVYYRRPEVAGILCCLRLDVYKKSSTHEKGFIARKIGITEDEEAEALADLVEVGKIHWNGTHYVPIEEDLELTDSRELNAFCHYWLKRAQTYLEELPNPHPVINFGMDIHATSAATMQKINDEYKQFYRRVRALLLDDKGPKDQVYVFNSLFFDLEKRHADVPLSQTTWLPPQKSKKKQAVVQDQPTT